ncbi:hypothetical protein QM480_04485 [Flectobacillus sp. DC10W]|uniref:Uncharacterized protein n=1 Tax=Flectobacillus longus TaxID=2984207 RepID=A0ABT6YIZ9_9BACT|nr:hypothetical protein [Flectobacillus longus]MDI9863566.1 hypothetical protein [Flectobacillus longus]
MKRNQFLKNTLVLVSGGFLLSCKNELITEFLSLDSTETPNIDEANIGFKIGI